MPIKISITANAVKPPNNSQSITWLPCKSPIKPIKDSAAMSAMELGKSRWIYTQTKHGFVRKWKRTNRNNFRFVIYSIPLFEYRKPAIVATLSASHLLHNGFKLFFTIASLCNVLQCAGIHFQICRWWKINGKYLSCFNRYIKQNFIKIEAFAIR